jgi:hypothetical protein
MLRDLLDNLGLLTAVGSLAGLWWYASWHHNRQTRR